MPNSCAKKGESFHGHFLFRWYLSCQQYSKPRLSSYFSFCWIIELDQIFKCASLLVNLVSGDFIWYLLFLCAKTTFFNHIYIFKETLSLMKSCERKKLTELPFFYSPHVFLLFAFPERSPVSRRSGEVGIWQYVRKWALSPLKAPNKWWRTGTGSNPFWNNPLLHLPKWQHQCHRICLCISVWIYCP